MASQLCHYCTEPITNWPAKVSIAPCRTCKRPLAFIPFLVNDRNNKAASLPKLGYLALLSSAAILCMMRAADYLGNAEIFCILPCGLIALGTMAVCDGASGLESCIERVRSNIYFGEVARRIARTKIFHGSCSLLLGMFFIIAY
ncbi:hypothetical protein N8940_00720 [Sphingomonadaceae bacterium]|nr:hypothetical protein [Sphingomonadaceae bacterium]